MPKLNAITSYLAAQDQVTPSMNTIQPTTVGIAHNKRVHAQLQRAIAASDTLHSLISTRDSSTDPEERKFAGKLLNDPQFLQVFSMLLDLIKDDITAGGKVKAAAAPASSAQTGGTEQAGPNYGESNSPNHRPDPSSGSNLPGADSAGPDSYTVDHLRRDLAARRFAPTYFYRRNPSAGMDAANAAVAKMQFVLDWSDKRWTGEARDEYRRVASYDTDAREDLAKHGISPEHESTYNSQRAAEKAFAGKWEGDQQ